MLWESCLPPRNGNLGTKKKGEHKATAVTVSYVGKLNISGAAAGPAFVTEDVANKSYYTE